MSSANRVAGRPMPPVGRVYLFRLTLLGLAASTLNGIVIALARRPVFLAAFPGATGPVLALLVATSVVGLASLVGMWLWQRWAVWLFGVVGLMVVGLDLVARGPWLHLLAAVGSTLLVLGLAVAVRERFKSATKS